MNGARRVARAAFGLVKGCHPGPVAAVTLAATGFAGATGAGPRLALRVGRAVLAGQLAIGWQNDWWDADRDRRAGRAEKPVVSGLVGQRTLGSAALASALACIPASRSLGRRSAAAHLIAVASAAAYNAGLKGTPLSVAPYGVSFALLPVTAYRAAHDDPTPRWAIASAAALGMAAHFVNVLPDRDADRSLGVLGLPQRLSPEQSLGLAAALLVSANASASFGASGFNRRSVKSFAGSALLGAAVIGAARGGRGRLPFRLVLVLALVQVAELLRASHEALVAGASEVPSLP